MSNGSTSEWVCWTTVIDKNNINDTFFSHSGYDSDVEREKNMDYSSKIYLNPNQEKGGVKPHLQETKDDAKLVLNVFVTSNTQISKAY